MKKLLILPLLILLTSCVTYYYPETAFEDGVYYAEDDPSYNVYHGYYPGYAYYPWASLDYFYIGYYPYPIYSYYYGFGYSPWHYPFGYYGYYPPIYISRYYYPRYATWYPYSGYCMGYKRCHRGHRDADNNGDHRLVGGHTTKQSNRAGLGLDENNVTPEEFNNPNATFYAGAVPYTRFVSTMPSGYSGNGGMVVRSGSSMKVGKSNIQPSGSPSPSNGIVIVSEPPKSSSTPASRPVGGSSMSSTRSASRSTPRSYSSSRSSGPARSASPARSSSSRSIRNSSIRITSKKD